MSTEQDTEAVVAKAPTITYTLVGTEIIRTDKDGPLHVANLSKIGGKLTLALIEEHARFRPAIVRHLNENELTPEAIILAGSETAAEKENARTDIPPMPKKSRVHGDKTPEVVEWYRKYKPNEYAARYGIIGPGTVMKERKVLDNDGKPHTELYEVDATIAQRKTHLTEKSEANTSGDQEYKD
jgi:hypothetical protein